jgi:hypothetical protein
VDGASEAEYVIAAAMASGATAWLGAVQAASSAAEVQAFCDASSAAENGLALVPRNTLSSGKRALDNTQGLAVVVCVACEHARAQQAAGRA